MSSTPLENIITSGRIRAALAQSNVTTLEAFLSIPPTDLPKYRQIGRSACEAIRVDLAKAGIEWDFMTERQKRFRRVAPYGKAYPSGDGDVYVAFSARMRAYKIGFSENARSRITAIRVLVPDAELTHTVRAGAAFEEWLHKRFASKCVMREWFELSADDLRWIASGDAHAEFTRQN